MVGEKIRKLVNTVVLASQCHSGLAEIQGKKLLMTKGYTVQSKISSLLFEEQDTVECRTGNFGVNV